jgi:hypothetical protein
MSACANEVGQGSASHTLPLKVQTLVSLSCISRTHSPTAPSPSLSLLVFIHFLSPFVRMGLVFGTFSCNLHFFTLFFFALFISLLEFAPLFVSLMWDSSVLAPESQIFL